MNSEGRNLSPAEIAVAEKQLAIQLENHESEWVAVRDYTIVASAPSFGELRERTQDVEIDTQFEVVPDGDTVFLG